jgi:hypothetical protein
MSPSPYLSGVPEPPQYSRAGLGKCWIVDFTPCPNLPQPPSFTSFAKPRPTPPKTWISPNAASWSVGITVCPTYSRLPIFVLLGVNSDRCPVEGVSSLCLLVSSVFVMSFDFECPSMLSDVVWLRFGTSFGFECPCCLFVCRTWHRLYAVLPLFNFSCVSDFLSPLLSIYDWFSLFPHFHLTSTNPDSLCLRTLSLPPSLPSYSLS